MMAPRASKVTWVVALDGSRVRVHAMEGAGGAFETVIAEDAVTRTQRSRDFHADRPGRTFDSAGSGRHAMEPSSDPHEQAKRRFVRYVSGLLADAEARGEYARLVVIAPPEVLGMLREMLPARVSGRVAAEVGKDLTALDARALSGHEEVREAVRPGPR